MSEREAIEAAIKALDEVIDALRQEESDRIRERVSLLTRLFDLEAAQATAAMFEEE